MELQAAGGSMAAAGGRQPDVLTVLLQLWMVSVLLAFLAGALCWKRCCSRQRQVEEGNGELPRMRPNQRSFRKEIQEDNIPVLPVAGSERVKVPLQAAAGP